MIAVWTLPERHLITELAVGLARRLELILGVTGKDHHMGPGYVHHLYTSEFESGCDVLWRLGVARAAYGPEPGRNELTFETIACERTWPPYFRFFARPEIIALLSGDPPASSPPLHEMLRAYLAIACGYGPSGSQLSSKRESFVPQQEYVRVIDALEHLGYIERHGTDVLWTDKIAPQMQEAYLWQPDGQSSGAVAEAALEDELAAALGATPEHTKRLLAQEAMRVSELDFAILLRDRFDGLYWGKNPDGTVRAQSGDVRLLKAVYRYLRTRC